MKSLLRFPLCWFCRRHWRVSDSRFSWTFRCYKADVLL